jgi:hypothetical protein
MTMKRAHTACLVGAAVGAALLGGVLGPSVAGADFASSSARPTGHINGSVTYCEEAGSPTVPVVMLHHRSGRIAATATWHGAGAPSESPNGNVYFAFTEPAGYYYLTQDNDYPIPPAARQIHLHARQTFTTHIEDCSKSSVAGAQEAQEAFVKAEATLAAQRAAAQRVAALKPKCAQDEVHITTSPGVPHMGGFTELVSVENARRTTCALGLYPLLTFHSATNPSIYTAGPSSSSPNDPATVPVVLTQGETATATFGGGDMTGAQTSCPTFSSFTANIAEGTPVTFHTTVTNCSGIEVTSFVAGFTGMTPATGRVAGRVPTCKATGKDHIRHGQLQPGPIVRVNFLAGNKAAAPEFVFASSKVSEPFAFDVTPGRYRVESAHGPARVVTIRIGRISELGLFGVCSKAIIPHSSIPNLTTTTTTTASATAGIAKTIHAELLVPDKYPAVYEMLAPGTAVPASEVFQETLKSGQQGSPVNGDAYGLASVQSQTYPVITTNGGQSWSIDGPIFHIDAADAPAVVDQIGNALTETVFVWGDSGHVVVSTDGGEHWWSSYFDAALAMGRMHSEINFLL